MYLYVHCSITQGGLDMEKIKCPLINNWIRKMWCIYTVECHLAVRKDVLPFATIRMDFECIVLSKISQMGEVKNHMTLLMCGI